MADKKYIAYDDAFHALDTVAMPLSTYECLVGRFCDIPAADVVPVVRCKDCKHYQHDAFLDHDWCDGRCVTPDYFCADGERRSMDGGEDDA